MYFGKNVFRFSECSKGSREALHQLLMLAILQEVYHRLLGAALAHVLLDARVC